MLDFFGFEILWFLSNFIGGTIRWLYGTTWRTIFNKPKFKYEEYVFGPNKSKNHFDIHGHSFNNMIITIIFIGIVIALLT